VPQLTRAPTAGQGHQQRNAHHTVVQAEHVPIVAVLPEVLAVVGRQHDERAREMILTFERIEQLAHQLVDTRHVCIVEIAEQGELARVDGRGLQVVILGAAALNRSE